MNAPFFITGASSIVAQSVTEDGGTYTFTNSFLFGDDSPTDFHGLDAIIPVSGTGPGPALPLGTLTALITDDDLGSGDPDGTISWTYTVSNSAIQFLAVGQQRTETFNIPVVDGQGNITLMPVTITITGANDAPVFTSSTGGPVVLTEDSFGAPATGSISFNDIDVLDTHTAVVSVAKGGVIAGLTLDDTALAALLQTTMTSTTTDATGSVAWTFTGTDAQFQYLDVGQILNLTYTIKIADGSGAFFTRDVAVTITGTADAATIAVVNRADVAEANTTTMVNFNIADQVTITDDDASDVADDYIDGSGVLSILSALTPPSGTLLSLITFDAGTGAVSYDRAAFNWLASGQSVTYYIAFNAQSGDDGVVAKTLAFKITGENDAPVFSSPGFNLLYIDTAGDNTFGPLGSTLTATDADTANTKTFGIDGSVASTNASFTVMKAGTYGTLHVNASTGAFEFVPTDAAIEARKTNATETFTFTVSDGTTTTNQTLTVSIGGENDAPRGTPTASLAAGTEDVAYTVTAASLLQGFTDAESDTLSISTLTSSNGTVVNNNDGTYTITPAANYNGPITLTYTVSDGAATLAGQTRTFTVGAVNDVDTFVANTTLNSGVLTGGNLRIGSGIPGSGFAVVTDATDAPGLEIGLNAGHRFTGERPVDMALDPTGRTYVVASGTTLGTPQGSSNTNDDAWARWNFQFSIGTDTDGGTVKTIGDYNIVFTLSTLDSNSANPVTRVTWTIDQLAAQIAAGPGGATAAAAFLNQTVFQGSENFEYILTAANAAGYNFDPAAAGRYRVSVEVRDEGNNSILAENFINIVVNPAPVAGNDTLAATEDTVSIFTVAMLTGNDTDAEGNPLVIHSVTSGAGGTAELLSDGTIKFTPNANFNGAATFTYVLSDGRAFNNLSNTATVTVNVAPVNDAPVITSAAQTGDAFEGGSLDNVVMAGDNPSLTNGFEPGVNRDTFIVSAINTNTAVSGVIDMAAVLVAVKANMGPTASMADVIAQVWDFLDDNYVVNNGNIDNNKAFIYLGIEYAKYLNLGGRPLTDVIVKYTPDNNADGIPQRLQNMHDNLLGNLS
ncbi:MAG: cadherin-like domain-containing protein, partial [Beijerinckiaceae bacterium]